MLCLQIQIFQIDGDYDEDSLKFRGLEQTMELRGGAGIDSGIYEGVFRGDVNCRDLEEVYSLFNVGGHPLHRGHSLSISDVVLTENGAFFCDHWRFKKLDFDPELAHKPDDLLRIVYVEPGRPLFVSEVGRDLLSMQKAVHGPLEVLNNQDGTVLLCNDEGKLIGMEGNRHVGDDVIAGPFLLIGDNGENLRSLTDAEVDRYMERFAQPEEISQEEVEESSGFTFISM